MVKEKNHILKILKTTKDAVKKQDNVKLKDLSNQTIHSASIHQDIDSILIAVIIYSLSKIIERENYQEYNSWNKFFSTFMKHIEKSIKSLEKDDEKNFRKELMSIRKEISSLSGKFKQHIKHVFDKASINKASRIYEHGISLEKTAELLGISSWELSEYAGKTGISDVKYNRTLSQKQRIKLALDFFEK